MILISCVLSVGASHAQIIDLETFGNGPFPGASLPVGQTNQEYYVPDQPAIFVDPQQLDSNNILSHGILDDGEYVLATDSQQGFVSWASIGDNTTGTGYMMLINANELDANDSFEEEFYRRTVPLTANTTFDFLTYAVNVNSQLDLEFCEDEDPAIGLILPNIRLQIENLAGDVLAFSDTGDIPFQTNPTWQEYSVTFSTDSSTTDVVIVLLNNSFGGCGNDLAIDDITFRVAVTLESADDIITITDTTNPQNAVLTVGDNDRIDTDDSDDNLPGGDGNPLPAGAVFFVADWSNIPTGLSFDTTTGEVSVAAGTPSGIYSFEYRVVASLPLL